VTTLEEFEVRTDEDDEEDPFDGTGMGFLEAELNDPPFSNGLISGREDGEDIAAELDAELEQVVVDNPADLVSGSDRLRLRGFPTPRLRNAFVQTGIPQVLGASRLLTIQGPLTPVTGRAAPGGIQNYLTVRPPSRARTRLIFDASSNDSVKAELEKGGPLNTPEPGGARYYHRLGFEYNRRLGPEEFSKRETTELSAALTARHSRAHSTMWQFDYASYDGNPSPGIPAYRETARGLVLGRYLPLENFHAYGPNAGVTRRTGSLSVQYEGQPAKGLSLRGVVQGVRRELEEERFTRGDYLVDVERFAGSREPQYVDRPLNALVVDASATWRFHAAKADHKLTLSVDSIHTDSTRLQRGLDADEKDELPRSVRRFDPADPDYFRPALTPDSYRRILIDRTENTRYLGAGFSERSAFFDGRLVSTAGLRFDNVDLEIFDQRPGAAQPEVTGSTEELTYHAGGNWVVSPGRLLLYANTSTAFEPSTRVDSRTGQIQGNESTGGIEIGLRGEEWDRRLRYSIHGFSFTNENISRRNPLYRDPIADANQSQPELVSAGREKFEGATGEIRLKVSDVWSLRGRAAYTDATTEQSPDLPDEVGRAISRVPSWTGALSSLHRWTDGPLDGWSVGNSLIFIGGYVDTYADRRRAELRYPGYKYVSVSLTYRWKVGKKTHYLSARVRNAFNENLLVKAARPGGDRYASLGYRLYF
jgi:iron complex outermembrane recepter protein